MTTDYITVSIAFILVVGRLCTKFFITKSPGWEDGKALLCHACVLFGLTMYGTGFSVCALIIAIGRVVGDAFGKYTFVHSSDSGGTILLLIRKQVYINTM